jgi:hypothetical protein
MNFSPVPLQPHDGVWSPEAAYPRAQQLEITMRALVGRYDLAAPRRF